MHQTILEYNRTLPRDKKYKKQKRKILAHQKASVYITSRQLVKQILHDLLGFIGKRACLSYLFCLTVHATRGRFV